MEAISASVLNQPPRLTNSTSCVAYSKAVATSSVLALPDRWRRPRPIFRSDFRDQGHVQYYGPSFSARNMDLISGELEKIEKDKSEKKMKKKQMKFLNGLTKDLSILCQMIFDSESRAGVGYPKTDSISEAAELLLEQLQKMRSYNEKSESETMKSESSDSECDKPPTSTQEILENNSRLPPMIATDAIPTPQPEVKIGSFTVTASCCKKEGSKSNDRDKEGDKLMRSMTLKSSNDCESSTSSSSSESSDSECDETMDMKNQPQLVSSRFEPTPMIENHDASFQLNSPEAAKPLPLLASSQVIDTQVVPKIGEGEVRKIEVCVGGKCKRSGALGLLEEFQRAVGADAAVSSCKCMGKCKEGPNVKVVNDELGSSLCIGVGLQDVELIVAKFLGDGGEDQIGFAAA